MSNFAILLNGKDYIKQYDGRRCTYKKSLLSKLLYVLEE